MYAGGHANAYAAIPDTYVDGEMCSIQTTTKLLCNAVAQTDTARWGGVSGIVFEGGGCDMGGF